MIPINRFRIFFILAIMAIIGCAPATKQIPIFHFKQYATQPEPVQTRTISDIGITVRLQQVTDFYDNPELFSFNLQDFPQFADNPYLKRHYPRDSSGRQWGYWFSSPDASEQLLLCRAQIKNGTNHILRMRDARIYLIAEGRNPIPAYSSFNELLQEANRFWNMHFQRTQQGWRWAKVTATPPPPGFYEAVLLRKRNSFELVNMVDCEILPGFTYEGTLVFPVVPASYGPLTLSFFDITTKTDAAGNAVEKTRFDFTVQPEDAQMWYDVTEHRWKKGTPPSQP